MLAAGTTLGPYRILAPLGAGGMGEVYRARDTRLGRDVAIKVIPPQLSADPERIKRFEQEARAAGALSHPNVCGIFDVGTHEGAPFVVMELLEGETLRERLAAGPIPVRKAIDYAGQAAHGLAAAHEKGIVHRDLKPENLFVTKDGRVKVLDFGLAKLTRPEDLASAGEKPTSIAATETGAILGTVGYMAPEQVRGQAVDARADLFALGAIIHELVSGRPAFKGDSFVETLHAILNAEPAPLSTLRTDVPPALESLVRHCLEKEPAERFQSARDLAFDLEGLSAASGSGTQQKRSPSHRSLVQTLAVAALSLAALVTATYFVARSGSRVPDPSATTYQRLTVRRGSIANARFSPDGKTVLYQAAWDGRAAGIYETRLGFPTSRELGLSRTNLRAMSTSGMMAVTAHDTLCEVPITGGIPRPLLDAVSVADWAPDGKTLAVVHRVGGEWRLEMPPGHVLYRTTEMLRFVRVSPDGRWIAIIQTPPDDTRGVVLVLDAGGRVRARTPEWNDLSGLAWSGDGREAWFGASEDMASYDLRAMTPTGRQRVVARLPLAVNLHDIARDGSLILGRRTTQVGIRGKRSPSDEERELGWLDHSVGTAVSSDGQLLLFGERGIGGGPLYGVYVRGMDGSPAVRLGQGDPNDLSRDGKWVVATDFGPPQRLRLLPTGTGDSLSLPRGGIEKYVTSRWMPDLKHVVFSGTESGHGTRIYIQDVIGGLPRPISPEGVLGRIPSPDGRFVEGVSTDRNLHAYPVEGGEPRLIVKLLPGERVLQWAADGRALYVGVLGWAHVPVDRIDVQSGERTRWTRFGPSDSVGTRVTWVALTPDAQASAYTYYRYQDDLYLVTGLK